MRLWPSYKFGESPEDGGFKLALDTRKRGFDAISQTIVTDSDKIYKMCIWGRARKGKSSYFDIAVDEESLLHGLPTKTGENIVHIYRNRVVSRL